MRLIDADSVDERLAADNSGGERFPIPWFRCWIGLQETIDAVPVVRCRECKHSSLPSKMTQIYGKEGTLTCHYGPCNRRNVSMDDFCSYGKRKDGDG